MSTSLENHKDDQSDTFSESIEEFAAQVMKMEQIQSKIQVSKKQKKPQNVPMLDFNQIQKKKPKSLKQYIVNIDKSNKNFFINQSVADMAPNSDREARKPKPKNRGGLGKMLRNLLTCSNESLTNSSKRVHSQ